MSQIQVTVLMSVYNAGAYLDAAVQSILGQTLGEFEFLIIDDGSCDGSSQRLDEWAGKDRRIRVVHQENAGLVAALNRGLELAQADYIARMDADDESLPRRLELQKAYLDAHPECTAVGCRVLMIDSAGWPIRYWSEATTHEEIDGGHLRGVGLSITHAASMFRKSAMLAVGGYRDQYRNTEDLDLFFRLAEYGKLANLAEALYRYRQHSMSVCHQKSEQIHRNVLAIHKETYARRGLKWHGREEPPPPSPTLAQQHQKWAWWALQSGYKATARKHALIALKHDPFSDVSWKTLACAIRGR